MIKSLICLLRDHRWIFLHTVSTLPEYMNLPPPITYICTRCGKIDSELFAHLDLTRGPNAHIKLTLANLEDESHPRE